MTPPFTEVPKSLIFTGNAPVEGLLSSLWMEPYVDGSQPHCCSLELPEVAAEATLLPPGITPGMTHDEDGRRSHLASGPGWTLLALRRRPGAATVRVCATSPELAGAVAEQAGATVAAVRPARTGEQPVGFWRRQPCGSDGVRTARHVTVPAWADIRGNYTAGAAADLDALMALRPERVTGRLVLLHGPTGTGKTTALRALTHEWRGWCQVDTVLDPDALFADPGYLCGVVMADAHRGTGRRWRLLVLEDCDELVGAGAKQDAGQALSRLLNLTDGMLGQGLDVLVCLTTNEDVGALHPAVVRPGRCLAEIEVGRLSRAEAETWLGEDGPTEVPPDGASLAELYRLRTAPGAAA